MVGAAMIPTIKVLLMNLMSFPAAEISLLWNFKQDLENLKNSVSTIQNFLHDAEMKAVTDKSVRQWLQKLEVVAFDAENVLDELNYEALRSKVQADHRTENSVGDFFSIANNPVLFERKLGKKMKEIMKELQRITEMSSMLGLQMRYVGGGAGTGSPASLPKDSMSVDPAFVGRENDVRKIVEMVNDSPTNEQVISILPIVGMGGVGKTTLARNVYNDDHILSHFEERIWVHVSENFDPDIVLKKTLTSLTEENVDGLTREAILSKIKGKLRNKRYLLVLDDVWNENALKWDNFINAFKGISSGKGNVIIITTRSERLPLIVKPICTHQLGVLSDKDCWFIIKGKADFEGDRHIEAIGKRIAKRCGGLPLAAEVVGCLLRGQSEDAWLSIETEWLSNFGGDENPLSKILKLSFDNLSSPSLKKCFAYCSIIPKGGLIEKEELIELWIAEGFIQPDRGTDDMEVVGNRYLNILVESSLLQVWERDFYGDAKKLGMHDLVNDLAFSLLHPQSLEDNEHPVRYVFPESSPIQVKKCRFLRTLFLRGSFSHSLFSKLECLHSLIMNGEEIKELPDSIGKLIHLKYLDIALTRIESLPESIGQLYHFQTLRATPERGGASHLRKLPAALKYLISLRHLHIPKIELPPEVGKLTSLQTLPYFDVRDGEGCGIAELGKLKNLRGELEITNLGKLSDKEEAKSAGLFHKPNISKLKLVWNDNGERSRSTDDDENVLEGLQPHPNLKSLEIDGFKGRSLPLWTRRMEVRDEGGCWVRLDRLIELRLSNCIECEEIPMLGNLPHLKYLYISHLTNLKTIGSSFYGNETTSTGSVFPKLHRLELIGLENLTAWEEAANSSSSVFPCLELLSITKCTRLESAPRSRNFPCLKEFEIFNVESPSPLENICGSNLTTLRKLLIWKVRGLVSLPDGLFSRNPHLSHATISECKELRNLQNCGASSSLRKLLVQFCPSLTEFPDLHSSLNALEELEILWCTNLNSIPYSGKPRRLLPLRKLEIDACIRLASLPAEMMESCAPSLERFLFKGTLSLTNFPELMSILHKMPRLIFLGIEIPKPSSSHGSLFPALQSLAILALYGAGADAIPKNLQHFTSLQSLSLCDFRVEALPQWMGSLSSLKTLFLTNCPNLSNLSPCKSLSKLSNLHMYYCPLLTKALEQSRRRNVDSEWWKISHIPTIYLDLQPISLQGEERGTGHKPT